MAIIEGRMIICDRCKREHFSKLEKKIPTEFEICERGKLLQKSAETDYKENTQNTEKRVI